VVLLKTVEMGFEADVCFIFHLTVSYSDVYGWNGNR